MHAKTARFLLPILFLLAPLAIAQDGDSTRRDGRTRRPTVDASTLPVEPIERVLRDADHDTVPDRKGEPVHVRGTVVVPTGILRTRDFQVMIQDETGGVGLFNRDAGLTLVAGDVVDAWGEVSQFKGAVQLQDAVVRKIGHVAVPTPRDVPVGEADSSKHIGRRVRVEGVVGELMLDDYGMLRVTGDDGGMISLFIPASLTDRFEWKNYPRGTRVSAVGVLSIYKPTWPYDGGFQLVMSEPADLAALEPPSPAWQKWLPWALLGALGVVGAAGLMLHVLHRRQRLRQTELKALSALSATLANTDLAEQHLARSTSEILSVYGIVDVALVQVFDEDNYLRQLAVAGADAALGAALASCDAVPMVDRSGDLPSHRIEAIAAEKGLGLLAVHPLPGSSGPLGFLVALSPRRRRPTQMQERTLLSAAKLLAMALENRRTQERALQERQELQQLVITDELTRLYNRRFLDEYLRVQVPLAQRHGSGLAFLAMDIDHFKHINDTYGHEAGDRVLAGVAAQLRAASRSCDLPVRLGGEEFLVVITEHDIDGALAFAERLRAAIAAQAFDDVVPGVRVHVTVSIGVAMFGLHGDSAATLLRASDDAMYASKRAGRNRVSLSTHIEAAGV